MSDDPYMEAIKEQQRNYLRMGGSGQPGVMKLRPNEYQEYPKWIRDADGKEHGVAQDAEQEAAMRRSLAPPPRPEAAETESAQTESAQSERMRLAGEWRRRGQLGNPLALSLTELRQKLADPP